MDERNCEPVAAVVRRLGCRSRLVLRGKAEAEPWASWLICPVAGYLEPEGCGPWPAVAVAWIDVDPGPHDQAGVVAALGAAGLSAAVVAGHVRVLATG